LKEGIDDIFVPCYIAFVVRVIKDIDVGKGKVSLTGTFVLRIPTYEMQQRVTEKAKYT
jgi:hypothetical protein